MYSMNVKDYEKILQRECLAIIRVEGKLFCLGCGRDITQEYKTGAGPGNMYHHPLCSDCRKQFGKIAELMREEQANPIKS